MLFDLHFCVTEVIMEQIERIIFFMGNDQDFFIDAGIDEFDVDNSTFEWNYQVNKSTYYDDNLESQCTIPLPDIRTLLKMFGLDWQ